MSIKVTIRRAELEDLQAITEIYNEAILTTAATFDTEVKNLADRRRWFDSHGERYPVLVAEVDGHVVGWGSLSQWSDRRAYDETAETTSYVKEQFRGQGIGRRLRAALIDEARRIGFHTLISRVAEESDASLHLSRSLGFRHIGTMKEVGVKFGRRRDVHIFQLMLGDDGADGSAPGADEFGSFVVGLEETLWTAVVHKDGDALARLLAYDYIEITLEGKRVARSDIVTFSPQIDEISGYAVDAPQVVPLGEDGAILSYHLTLDGRCRGELIQPPDRWATSVWTRTRGTWLCRYFQQTAFVPASE
jgi:phosphinothricin acetyltransferase